MISRLFSKQGGADITMARAASMHARQVNMARLLGLLCYEKEAATR